MTTFALSSLDGTNGFVIHGVNAGDSAMEVSFAGDFNGDGLEDVLIGVSQRRNAAGEVYAGGAYVLFGSSSGFGSSVELSALNGTNGVTFAGDFTEDLAGQNVESIGDANGDGIDDIVVSGHCAEPANGFFDGETYILYGKTGGFSPVINLSSLNGSNGSTFIGAAAREYISVTLAVGDINGDGFADFLLGTGGLNTTPAEVYVVFGTGTGFGVSLNVSSLNGVNGFKLTNPAQSENFHIHCVGTADINGDGYDDIALGASGANDGDGATYIVYGKSSGFGASLNLSALNGTNGFTVNAAASGDLAGSSLASAGDVNGDGIDDLLVGAAYADPKSRDKAGAVYVVFGSTSGFGVSLNLSSLDGANGFKIEGAAAINAIGQGQFGAGDGAVAAGDFNGDGVGDILIGSVLVGGASTGRGAVYVVFGSTSGFAPTLDLAAPSARVLTFPGAAFRDIGSSFAGASDMNGDGIDDILLAGKGRSVPGGYAGATYVVYGSTDFGPGPAGEASGSGDTLSLNIAAAGAVTVILNSAGQATVRKNGVLVPVVGVNAGLDEIDALGVLNATTKITGNSAANAIGGSNKADNIDGGGGNDLIFGNAGSDTLRGAAGNDTLDGGGGGDTYRGSPGVDRYVDTGTSGVDRIIATAANATIGIVSFSGIEEISANGFANVKIFASAAADTLDFTSVAMTGIAMIDGGGGNDSLTGSMAADRLTGGAGKDTLRGGVGADTLTGGGADDRLEYFGPGFGADRVTDFDQNGNDQFRMIGMGAAFDTFSEILAASSQNGVDVVINFGGGDTITLANTTLASLTASDFILN